MNSDNWYCNTMAERRKAVHALLESGDPLEMNRRIELADHFHCSIQTIYHDILWYFAPTDERCLRYILRRHWGTLRGHTRRWGRRDTLTFDEYYQIMMASGGQCAYCGEQVGIENLTADHRIPLALGGVSERENIVPACADCNLRKHAQLEWIP